ncbi:MAG: hypothetical protein AAGC56_03135 [Pseudomonadota bacterium]
MVKFRNAFVAGVVGAAAFATASAAAAPAERAERAGPQTFETAVYTPGAARAAAGDAFIVNAHHVDRRRGFDNGFNARRRRTVNRLTLPTRFRARVVVREDVVLSRRGVRRLVCTVTPRGPEAGFVTNRRLRRVARNYCSPRARVRIFS